MAVVTERAFTSRSTLQRVEAGDTNVSIGIYAGVLQALGLLDGLSQVVDISSDSVGQALASADLIRIVPRWLTLRSISIWTAGHAPLDWREAIASAARKRSSSNMKMRGLRTRTASLSSQPLL
jgi:hypothetical protein